MLRSDDSEPSARLGSIDYNQAPDAVYYVDATGERWRVHDCVFVQGKTRGIGLPDAARATCRLFVNAAGVKRVRERMKGEISEATEAQLVRQFAGAQYLPTTGAFDSVDRTAR